jgi:GTP-binding protein SAR1
MEYLRKIFSSFLNFFSNLQQRKARIIFFGLDNAGKTSLLRRLKDGTFSQHPPTLFSHQEEVRIGNVNVKAIDIGGH